jgi:chromosome segregation ATPase
VGAHEDLERKEKELANALAEAARLREETQRLQDECDEQKKRRVDFSIAASHRQSLGGSLFGSDGDRLGDMEGRCKTEFEELRAQLGEAIRDRDTLAQRLETLSENTEHDGAASTELARVREDLHYARAELASIAEQRAILQVDAGRRENEFKAVVASLKDELAESSSAVRAAREQAASAEKEREEMKTRLSSAMSWESQAIAGRAVATRLQDQMAAILTEHQSHKADLAQAAVRLKALQSDLDTTKAQLEVEQGKLRDLGEQSGESDRGRIKMESERAGSEAIAAAQSDDQTLRAQLIDSQRALAVMRLERDRVRVQLQEREEGMRKAAGTVDAARTELERRRQEHSELTVEHEQLKTALAEATEEAKELQQRVDNLLDDLHARERELAEARQTLATSIVARHDGRAQIAALSCEQEKLKAELTEANRRSETAQQRLEASEAEVRQWQRRAEEMLANGEVARREREDAVARLAAKEVDARATSTRLWEEGAAAMEKLTELERRLEAATAENRAIRTHLETARSDRDEIGRQVAGKDAEMRELTAQSERQKTVEHTFLLHLQAAETNVAAAREKSALLESERKGVDGELAKSRAAFDQVCEQLAQVKNEREAARAALIGLEMELEKSLDQRNALEKNREALGADLDATRAGLERAKQHIAAIQTRRDQMRDEIARLKIQLGMAPDSRG